MEKIKIITPNDEGYSNQEHICLSCNQDRSLENSESEVNQ